MGLWLLSASSPLGGHQGPWPPPPVSCRAGPHTVSLPQLIPTFQLGLGGTRCLLNACILSPAVGPPMLIPIYFQYQIISSMILYKQWAVSRGALLAWGVGRRVSGRGACAVPLCASVGPQASPLGVVGCPVTRKGTCSGARRQSYFSSKDPFTHEGVHWEPPPLQNPLRKFQKAT